LAAGLVMLLSLSSVSPELHVWLHEKGQESATHVCAHHDAHAASDTPEHAPDSDRSDDHTCAVTMFSHGVVYHVAALVARPGEGILRAVHFRAFERLALAQPRFLHLPPQAPPAV